jgi:transposase
MLIAFRQELVGRRVAAQNRTRARLAGAGLPVPRGHRAWTAAGLAGIEGQARPLAEADPATALLESTPGLGRRTAEAVAAHLGDAKRFASGKQVGAYAGLGPKQYPSGRPTGPGGSPAGGRCCCGSCWSSAPGACSGTTRGRGRPTPG